MMTVIKWTLSAREVAGDGDTNETTHIRVAPFYEDWTPTNVRCVEL
jgi:hypothetical protein